MNLSGLSRIVRKANKRLGRGHGSGKVKTGGRGTKGQKARGKMPRGFEGGQLSLIKRLPLLRGKGRNGSQKFRSYPLSVGKLDSLPKGVDVTLETLIKHRMIEKNVHQVKVVGKGKLVNAYNVRIRCTGSAKIAIEKAGGTVLAV